MSVNPQHYLRPGITLEDYQLFTHPQFPECLQLIAIFGYAIAMIWMSGWICFQWGAILWQMAKRIYWEGR